MEENFDGNPLERAIFSGLLAVGLLVLLGRRRKVVALLRRNAPILLFFGYCAISTAWSDYPDVAFKRWIKGLGDVVMVMIVLTDAEQSAAVKQFLARIALVMVPLSVLLIRYYPGLGRAYKQDGKQVFVGITNNKNTLGVICMLAGLSAIWRLLCVLREKRRVRSYRPLMLQGAILSMVLWLFWKANSMTCLACFALAGALLIAISFPAVARNRAAVHLLVVTVVAVATVALFFDAASGLIQTVGRDPTLTGRTELWDEILGMTQNPLFGSGFESFWLGSRLEEIWKKHWWHPNEAHNGYIEMYLNLGWVGVTLLAVLIVSGYRNGVSLLRRNWESGALRLTYFVVGLTYSLTEAGFRLLSPVWICFLLAVIAIPKPPAQKKRFIAKNPVSEAATPEWRYAAN